MKSKHTKRHVKHPTTYAGMVNNIHFDQPAYTAFLYSPENVKEFNPKTVSHCEPALTDDSIIWINIDGINEKEVTALCAKFGVHPLIIDDILSRNERPKMEETDNLIHCVLPMLFVNPTNKATEMEQVSIVLGKNFLLSFQQEPTKDVFDPIRKALRDGSSKLRNRTSDYLCYSMLDLIVDSYFEVLEFLSNELDGLEDQILIKQTKEQLSTISDLRSEITTIRRVVLPVRELVAHFVRSDNDLLQERHEKYFRDVLDHTIQANDYIDGQRDTLMNLQDLYMNQLNLKMNEVMKMFTMVATLLAPATVIGGIFGMNFDVIPLQHHYAGFNWAVGSMIIIPVAMLFYFKRKGWF